MVQKVKFEKINKVQGELNLPGDKSISHRALIFSAMAEGESRIENLSGSFDVQSTKNCLRDLGIEIVKGRTVLVKGKGYKGFIKPASSLDAGNSGTTARLLTGLLSAQNFDSEITGDDSLSQRPMKRIIDPLKMMGAKIEPSVKNTLPLKIKSVKKLQTINYVMPVASAQVKSAIILAGLHSEEISKVIETSETRDHTERMLGLKCEKKSDEKIIYFSKKDYPEPKNYFVPSDISAAIFFTVLTLITKNSELKIKKVSLNKSRTEILNILREMGGKIEVENVRESNSERYGDIIVESSELRNVNINKSQIANIIDEILILTIAGLFAEGDFVISGAEELRYKESDRINSVCTNLKMLGLGIEELPDGYVISGNIKSKTALFNSYGDHRIAMSFAVLSSLLHGDYAVSDFDCVNISNPSFLNQLKSISH